MTFNKSFFYYNNLKRGQGLLIIINKMKKGHIFFIMWVSWAGKWTLINNLKKQDLDLHIPLSYKSRKKREFETHWVDSYFISVSEFRKAIENWEFLEYAIVHGKDYYWTKYDDVVLNGIEKSKIVIKELDILWLEKLREQNPSFSENYTTIFLNIPVEKLSQRIATRGDNITVDQLQAREESAIMEEKKARQICDHIIDATQSIEQVLEQVLSIITNVKK